MPAFANSVQTGFMAISNNVPMLIDQVNLLKRANAELKAQGQDTIPVWKQLVSGIFSWQTALSVGLTLLVVYGKEIGNFITNLFSAEKATKSLSDSQKELSENLDLVIERISALNKEQISQLDFNTKAQIIQMKLQKDKK